MKLRYGMNPHQSAQVAGDRLPLRVVSGEPSYLNLLDALTGWQLVREVTAATGAVAAASIKHTSPAGVAVPGSLDTTMQETWWPGARQSPVLSACIRARDADPKSSFGDMIAVSAPVDAELAEFLAGVVSDGIIAPGFEPGTVGRLAAKKRGRFLTLEMGCSYVPPRTERRDVFGVILEQQRDDAPITPALLQQAGDSLPPEAITDALLGLYTLRYTQSNSVALVRGGATLAVAAGQQSRVDCIRLCVAKAAAWWLRRHPAIAELPRLPGMTRQDWLNWQLVLAGGDPLPRQAAEIRRLFPDAVAPDDDERRRWLALLDGLCLVSDGYLPFRDNIDEASRLGVRFVVEPGGSSRSEEVAAACAEYGMTLVRTGLRLFHH